MTYNPRATREAWDEEAESEDGFEKEQSLRNEIPREFIQRYLRASDVVLDAGGGAAFNAIMMAQRCKRVTLVDISPKMLELAAINIKNAGLTEVINLLESDITNLEQFGDSAFSFVVCVGGSMSFVLEKGHQAIQELVRVAKKGSVLIIGCDSKYGMVRYFLREGLLDEAIRVDETSEYYVKEAKWHFYTVAEMTGLLEETGCQVLEVASTPTLMNSIDESMYKEDEEKWKKLKELELKACTVPELLGTGHHLIFVARKV